MNEMKMEAAGAGSTVTDKISAIGRFAIQSSPILSSSRYSRDQSFNVDEECKIRQRVLQEIKSIMYARVVMVVSRRVFQFGFSLFPSRRYSFSWSVPCFSFVGTYIVGFGTGKPRIRAVSDFEIFGKGYCVSVACGTRL